MSNVMAIFDGNASRVLNISQTIARHMNHARTGTAHLLLGFLRVGAGSAYTTLVAFDLSYDAVFDYVNSLSTPKRDAVSGLRAFDTDVERIIERVRRGVIPASQVRPEHLLLALLDEPRSAAHSVLLHFGVDPQLISETMRAALRTQYRQNAEQASRHARRLLEQALAVTTNPGERRKLNTAVRTAEGLTELIESTAPAFIKR